MNTREVFKRNLNKYIDLSGKTKREISEEIPIPYTTLVDWSNGNKFPRADGIEKLANYFKILKSDLLEEKLMIENEGTLIYNRNGEIIRKKFTKEQMDYLEKFIRSIGNDNCDL